MKSGVVTEIAEITRREARELKDPFTKEILGRTLLYEPSTDGTFRKTDLGGPGLRPAALQLHTLTGSSRTSRSRRARESSPPATRSSATGRRPRR